MSHESCIVWFRQDLRLEDNSALASAIRSGRKIVPVYIWCPEEEGEWAPGGASRWWLHHALGDLDQQLRKYGGQLILRNEKAEEALFSLIRETGARAVYWNRRYEPDSIKRDTLLKSKLQDYGVEAVSENSSLLHEPHTIENKQGEPYKVFTRYYKQCLTLETPDIAHVDFTEFKVHDDDVSSLPLESLKLLPEISWDGGLKSVWDPTRAGAVAKLDVFEKVVLSNYGKLRNRPDIEGTSRLSPFLHHGQVGPRELLRRFGERKDSGTQKFIAEIYWREFGYHILYHFPDTTSEPLRPEFNEFPWQDNDKLLKRWQNGETGFPIVDAGMRQLWDTGWMHNRLRMNVASLLVKHMLIPWRRGAEWFWDTLVDADLASNTLGWQWAGGCGADAAPYFRIFNPILQGKKFDPEGDFVRRYIPELKKLPDEYIHAPWEASSTQLKDAGIEMGKDYPYPVIKHEEGRARALKAFEKLQERKKALA